LGELNDGVEGKADIRSLQEVLANDKERLSDFTIVIAHNLEAVLLDQLASFLWEDSSYPPLVIVRSAGFLAEVYIQYHEHTGVFCCLFNSLFYLTQFLVIESHPETAQSLQIDKPFPALLQYAMSLDFKNMDTTDHGHIPYVIILVRLLEEWKKTVGVIFYAV